MKKNFSKKLLTAILTATLSLSMGMTAFAAAPKADGTEAATPQGTGDVADSTGAAVAEKTTAEGAFTYAGDDDNKAKATDNDGADINVWAKITDDSTKIYKVDIGWGAMKFEYNTGGGSWNVETHTYDVAAGGEKGWVDTYVDGINNKVTVTNHSNAGVDAGFVYAMTETNQFNDAAGANNVVGNFFDDNAKALTAAAKLENPATTVVDKLTDSKITLATAEYTDGVDDAAAVGTGAARTDDVYFAFSGTPDEGKATALTDFTKVGVITVTVSPVEETPAGP